LIYLRRGFPRFDLFVERLDDDHQRALEFH
jgi:hypothetical protein